MREEKRAGKPLGIDIMEIYRMSCSKCKKKLEALLLEREGVRLDKKGRDRQAGNVPRR